jgi:hypothetical protein
MNAQAPCRVLMVTRRVPLHLKTPLFSDSAHISVAVVCRVCGGWCRGDWGSGTLLQPPEDLGRSLFVQADAHQRAGVTLQRPGKRNKSLC